jgi:hypothetical protein
MGLASSVPANATAGQFPAMYQAPRSTKDSDTYTDKRYVDDKFVTNDNFNQFFTTSYKTDVNDPTIAGSWAFAKAGATSNRLSDYVTSNNLSGAMKTQLETANSPARTAFNTVFNDEYDQKMPVTLASTAFGDSVRTNMTNAGYNPLTNYYVKQDGSGKLCHYAKSNNQRELCIDESGKLYLQGLGLKANETDSGTDSDVYSYILTQNSAFWTARDLAPLNYNGGYVYNSTNGLIKGITAVGTVNLTATPTRTASTIIGETTTVGTITYSKYTITWTGTVTFSGNATFTPAGSTFSKAPTITVNNNKTSIFAVSGTEYSFGAKDATETLLANVTISNVSTTGFTYTATVKTLKQFAPTPNIATSPIPTITYTATAN